MRGRPRPATPGSGGGGPAGTQGYVGGRGWPGVDPPQSSSSLYGAAAGLAGRQLWVGRGRGRGGGMVVGYWQVRGRFLPLHWVVSF